MSATDEIPVKSEIFKDIKYYVSGTIEPEVRIIQFMTTTTQF